MKRNKIEEQEKQTEEFKEIKQLYEKNLISIKEDAVSYLKEALYTQLAYPSIYNQDFYHAASLLIELITLQQSK